MKGEEPDLDRIKRLLADVARSIGIPSPEPGEASRAGEGWTVHAKDGERRDSEDPTDERLTTAIAWLRSRDERDRVFGADLFFDPAWNMLLDLYVNERRGAVVSVSSLCIAARVPSTTALRWLTLLERRGLIGRRPDDYDRRRSFLFLTGDGRAKIEATLDRAASAGRSAAGYANRLN